MDHLKIITIDPGITSGFCYAELKPNVELVYKPFQMVDDVDDLWNRLDKFKPDTIIIEDFEFRGRARAGLNLFPVQLIGIARLYENRNKVALHLQKAATGKAYYTDNILKQLGLYKRGIPHGMDASRHLLQWITFGPGFQYNGKSKIEDFVTMSDELSY